MAEARKVLSTLSVVWLPLHVMQLYAIKLVLVATSRSLAVHNLHLSKHLRTSYTTPQELPISRYPLEELTWYMTPPLQVFTRTVCGTIQMKLLKNQYAVVV